MDKETARTTSGILTYIALGLVFGHLVRHGLSVTAIAWFVLTVMIIILDLIGDDGNNER
jgi:hypothetical protein